MNMLIAVLSNIYQSVEVTGIYISLQNCFLQFVPKNMIVLIEAQSSSSGSNFVNVQVSSSKITIFSAIAQNVFQVSPQFT